MLGANLTGGDENLGTSGSGRALKRVAFFSPTGIFHPGLLASAMAKGLGCAVHGGMQPIVIRRVDRRIGQLSFLLECATNNIAQTLGNLVFI